MLSHTAHSSLLSAGGSPKHSKAHGRHSRTLSFKRTFSGVLRKQLKGIDLPAATGSAGQSGSAQHHHHRVPWEAVPAPTFTATPRAGWTSKSESAAPTIRFPYFLLLHFPISIVTKGIHSSYTDMKNFCLLMRTTYFCLYLNLLDLTEVL